MATDILQLVPDLAAHTGVANHARALAAGLRSRQLDSVFLTIGPAPANGVGRHVRLARATSRDLWAALESSAASRLVVHYSNYGYAPRGCPLWLVASLERWRRSGNGRRLITVFHELYATGRPWQSSFWLSPIQRHLARKLSRLSDAAVTSVDRFGEILRRWDPENAVVVLPVFSSAGESAAPSPLSARPAQMVVFGSAGLRARAYRDVVEAVVDTSRALGIQRIIDVGPGEAAPRAVAGVPVDRRGFLAAGDLVDVLAESRAGFLAYPTAYLPKSSVFAAYCAFGLLPVCAWPKDSPAPDQPPFWRVGASSSLADCEELALLAHAWYCRHSLAHHVETYGSLLQ